MKYPTSTLIFNNKKFILTWIKDGNLEKYSPISQVYGIVFNNNGEILIARSKPEDSWVISGGTPEAMEMAEETLRRELREEVNIKVGKILSLGAQKVEPEVAVNNNKGTSYQLRYVVLLDKMLPRSLDPANGRIWERKFVSVEKITEYVKWGETGDAMFKDAVNLYKKLKNHSA